VIRRETDRLAAPHREVFRRWWDAAHDPRQVTVTTGTSPAICADLIIRDDSEVLTLVNRVNMGLANFTTKHPRPEPYFTPTDLLAEIEVAEVMSGQFKNKAELARDDYLELRAKVSQFSRIVPEFRDDPLLTEAVDPVVGLQNLRLACDRLNEAPTTWRRFWTRSVWGLVIVLFGNFLYGLWAAYSTKAAGATLEWLRHWVPGL
jgi:hypothetical protein